MTTSEVNSIKREAVQELLASAQTSNTALNKSLVELGEVDRVIAFTSVPVRYIQSYADKLNKET
jgi:hypothetical protein